MSKEKKSPWEAMGVSRRTYYNRQHAKRAKTSGAAGKSAHGVSAKSALKSARKSAESAKNSVKKVQNSSASAYALAGSAKSARKSALKSAKNAPAVALPKEHVPFGKQFVKGKTGNPAGRPPGSRNKLDEVFVAAIYRAFEEGGDEAIKSVMVSDPAAFLNVVVRILPRHVQTKVQISLADLSDAELANIAAGGGIGAVASEARAQKLN